MFKACCLGFSGHDLQKNNDPVALCTACWPTNGTSSLFPFVQKMDLAIEPLRISTMRMGFLTRTSNLMTWWSCGQEHHRKRLDNQAPLSKVAFGLCSFSLSSAQLFVTHRSRNQKTIICHHFKVFEWVQYTILISNVYSSLTVIVEMDHKWLLMLNDTTICAEVASSWSLEIYSSLLTRREQQFSAVKCHHMPREWSFLWHEEGQEVSPIFQSCASELNFVHA